MSNNTKIIMETWRRFLNEDKDPNDGQKPQKNEPPFEKYSPPKDEDMSGMSDKEAKKARERLKSFFDPRESSVDDDEGPQGFDFKTQGGETYFPDEAIIDEIKAELEITRGEMNTYLKNMKSEYPLEFEEALNTYIPF